MLNAKLPLALPQPQQLLLPTPVGSLRQFVCGRSGLPFPEPCGLLGFEASEDFHQDKEQRACPPPKRVCTGGTDLETVPWLAVPGLFQEAPSPKFIFCWFGVFFSQGYALSIV